MKRVISISRIWFVFAVIAGLGLTAGHADAQSRNRGNSAGQGNGRGHSAEVRQQDRRGDWEDERYPDRDDDWYSDEDRAGEKKGPAFCRSGAGHPVHGIEWCRDRGYDRSVWDYGTLSNSRSYGSDYERAHYEFHRELDRRYDDRMSRAGIDVAEQLRLRVEKTREHDRWHERAGIPHQ